MTIFDLEQLARDAQAGSREALEALVREIQPVIYKMAFRMLGFPEDAEDAAQEILIKVITHLGDFRGDSALQTWVFRIACNHLLTARKRRAEQLGIDFEVWESMICQGESAPASDHLPEAEKAMLLQEVRIGCVQGLLICLDREHRIALILGEIFGVNSREGAAILEITPEAFRKRLSRSRKAIHKFMRKNCGLIEPQAPCRCEEQVHRDIAAGLIDPAHLRFAGYFASPREHEKVLAGLSEMEALARMTYLLRQYPVYRAPAAFAHMVKDVIDSGRFPLLNG